MKRITNFLCKRKNVFISNSWKVIHWRMLESTKVLKVWNWYNWTFLLHLSCVLILGSFYVYHYRPFFPRVFARSFFWIQLYFNAKLRTITIVRKFYEDRKNYHKWNRMEIVTMESFDQFHFIREGNKLIKNNYK